MSEKGKGKNQLLYFPYLGLKEDHKDIQFGEVRIWRYSPQKLQEEIAEPALRDAVMQRIGTNKTFSGVPLEGIGVVSVGKSDFRVLTDEEFALADEGRLILFIASLSKNNIVTKNSSKYDNHNWVTSDNFELIVQNFDINSEYTAYEDGAIHQLLSGGWKVKDVEFRQPSFVHKPLIFGYDTEFAESLWKLKKRKKKLYSRILKSTSVFFDAYRNSPHVSWDARMLLQTESFEILLNFRDRKEFKAKIEDYCKLENGGKDKRVRYKYERGNNTWETRTIKGYWADRFYTLRNHIIHGHKVGEKEYYFGSQRHFDVALMFYLLVLKRILNNAFDKKIFYDEIHWDKKEKKFLWDRETFLASIPSLTKLMNKIKILKGG